MSPTRHGPEKKTEAYTVTVHNVKLSSFSKLKMSFQQPLDHVEIAICRSLLFIFSFLPIYSLPPHLPISPSLYLSLERNVAFQGKHHPHSFETTRFHEQGSSILFVT